uniref:(California timema) hypothetical protein n=1 Tax=Timema californicum TaxID=61474 RepID=A0A7R9J6V7_TIMCA|nr:unnamed protein product [Timema californicum]
MNFIIVFGILMCLLDFSYAAFKKRVLKPTTPAPKTPIDYLLIEKYNECKDLEGNTPEPDDLVNCKKVGGIPKSEGGKCLATCMMKSAGLVDDNGQFSVKGCQELVKKMSPHLAGPASDFFILECEKKSANIYWTALHCYVTESVSRPVVGGSGSYPRRVY